jgi:hypothetical protein
MRTPPPPPPPANPPATSTALLPAISVRLVKLLEDALVVGVGHTPTVRLAQPRELAHGSAEGITLTLIGVHSVPAPRNAPARPAGEPTAPPAALIEAHYLLTAWANQATLQQWMLAAALRQVHLSAVIAGSELKHPFNAGATLGVDAGTSYRLVTRNLSLEETAALAAAIGAPALPPSVVIVAGPIALD